VDLDDCRTGPAIQDLWMLVSGEREEMQRQLGDLNCPAFILPGTDQNAPHGSAPDISFLLQRNETVDHISYLQKKSTLAVGKLELEIATEFLAF
jgi:hypothetical protein